MGCQMRLSNLIILNSKVNDLGNKVAQDLEANYRQATEPIPKPKPIPDDMKIPLPDMLKHFIHRLRDMDRRRKEPTPGWFKEDELWLVLNDLGQYMLNNRLQGMPAFQRVMEMLDAYNLKDFQQINLEEIANLLQMSYWVGLGWISKGAFGDLKNQITENG